MGLDFDAVEYCKNVKQKQAPPYACPKCERRYKTVVGLQYHLVNYDHDNPQPLAPALTPNRKKARSRTHHSTPKMPKGSVSASGHQQQQHVLNPESLVTYNDDEETVQFNLDGKSVRLGIDESLPFITDEQFEELLARGCVLNADAPPLEQDAPWANVEVPEAHFQEIDDYNVPDAPPRPLAYYRFIEKSAEELDGEIEYDVDEEDTIWLDMMNEQRETAGLTLVSIDTMEMLMDRLEKESYFQAAANGTTTGVEVDDDAVCCICMDGECQNTNVILFCDMCNLAVHQDCYGVPYIPEGQWLCRRCLQSPSTPVSCVLCPNSGGAFKQTDRGEWAHVVCALWIPEVRFANTVFLEPIDSIETIPAARWRLTCYVCKEKGKGACIQCHRNSCYSAFHVTCAQQAGLYMTMDTVKDGHNDSSVHVQKYAYCHAHTPADAKLKTNQKEVEDTRHKMKEARKALAKKRSTAPIVLIPTIPPERVQEIAALVHMQKKTQFLERLIAYWTLKRQHRNGVPLLRRLQSQGNHHAMIHRNGIEGSPDTTELYKQLKYWQCLRQDLERARLLCELVRKREKLKAAYVKMCEQVVMLQLNPLDSALNKLLDALEAKDTTEIFREPVDIDEVPDYLDIVQHPMDLGTMRNKLRHGKYATLEQLEVDFDLMIQNCLAYNNKDTVFYRAGIRMRDQAAPLFVQVRKELEREGLIDFSHNVQQDHVELEVEDELRQLLSAQPSEKIVQKLLILADKSQVLKNPSYRTKKIKQIRLEITRMRKIMQKSKSATHNSSGIQSQSDDDDDEDDLDDAPLNERIQQQQQQQHHHHHHHHHHHQHATSKRGRKPQHTNNTLLADEDDTIEEEESKDTTTAAQTPPCSPIKSLNNSASPVGVNRRTAVLLTRKAQAVLKRPSETTTPVKEETAAAAMSNNNSSASAAVAALAAASLASSASTLNNKLSCMTPLSASLGGLSAAAASMAVKSPKRNARHKRLSEMRSSGVSMSPKKSPNATLTATVASTPSEISYDQIPDSFRVYRANNERDVSDSDDDDLSDISGSPCSSCSGFSVSGSGSEYDSSDDDEDDDDGDGEPQEDDDEDDDDDDDDDEEDGDGEESETANGNVEMRNVESPSVGVGLGVGKAQQQQSLHCSADSCSDDDDEDEDRDEPSNANAKSISKRTPTPSEKRIRNTSKAKQKKSNGGVESQRTALEAKLNNVETAPPKNSTRAVKQLIATRSNTPTVPSPSAVTAATTLPAKTRKLANNNRMMNNTRSATARASPATQTPQQAAEGDATADDALKPPLEPLQLVWAKCRGYPWYPALILDPKTPKGFVYNGVPLPAPPPDVLALRKNYIEDVLFLVLFFDAKRTWQWLPANKLEILGIDKRVDQQKLIVSRKPTERKAVKKAYQDALHYQSQVSDLEGQGPDPIM